MTKTFKRVLATVLTVMMVLSMVSVFALANETVAFADSYQTKYLEEYGKEAVIEDTALLVDNTISADEQAAESFTRTWDGIEFSFTYNVNAFTTLADAYASANFVKDVIVLGIASSTTADLSISKASRVFSPAWDMVPMNEMGENFNAIASDGADWTVNNEFASKAIEVKNLYYTNALTSGTAEVYGFAVNNVIGWGGAYGAFRTPNTGSPITMKFVNGIYKAATNAMFFYKYVNGADNNDTAVVKNVYMQGAKNLEYSGQGRPHMPANVVFDGLYYDITNMTNNNFFQSKATTSSVTIRNSYIKGSNSTYRFCISHNSNGYPATGTRVVTLNNNVFKHSASGGMLYMEPHDTNKIYVTNNYMDKTADGGALLLDPSAVTTIGSRLSGGQQKELVFEGNKILGYSKSFPTTFEFEFTPKNNFVTTAKGDAAKISAGVELSAPVGGAGAYWVDYNMTMSSVALSLAEGNVEIGGVAATVDNDASSVEFALGTGSVAKADFTNYTEYNQKIADEITSHGLTTVKPTVTIKDLVAGTTVDSVDTTKEGMYTVTLAFGTLATKQYSVKVGNFSAPYFNDETNGYVDATGTIGKDAILLDSSLVNEAADSEVIKVWDGNPYTFKVGTNAFGTYEVAEAAVSDGGKIIVTGWDGTALSPTKSVNIYSPNWNTVPMLEMADGFNALTSNGADWTPNPAWQSGYAVNGFTPTNTNITVGMYGFEYTAAITPKHNGSTTTTTIKNSVYNGNADVLYLGNSADNNDKLTVVNMYVKSAKNLLQEKQTWAPSEVTIEGLYFNVGGLKQYNYFLTKAKKSSVTIKDSYIYGTSDYMLSLNHTGGVNTATDDTRVFTIQNNTLKYNSGGKMITFEPHDTTGVIIKDNFMDFSAAATDFVFSGTSNNSANYVGYRFKDNAERFAAIEIVVENNKIVNFTKGDNFYDTPIENNNTFTPKNNYISADAGTALGTVLNGPKGSADTYWLDYNMTKTSAGLSLGNGNVTFGSVVTNVDDKANTISTLYLSNNKITVDNIEKVIEDKVKAELGTAYNDTVVLPAVIIKDKDGMDTNAIDTSAKGTYTVKLDYGITSRDYAVSITELSDIADYQPTGNLKAGFGVLVPDGAGVVNDKYLINWQGDSYLVSQDNAFTSVADAITAGKTQLIMPEGDYAKVQVSGAIELYGNHFGKNPNVIGEDRTDDWTLNPAWNTGKTTVAELEITSTANGAKVAIDGIELTDLIDDGNRAANNQTTEIIAKNILISKDMSKNQYIVYLANANAKASADSGYVNTDSFKLVDSRINFDATSSTIKTRFFTGSVVANITIEGTYFGDNYPLIGFPSMPATTVDGSFNLVNNYFGKYRTGAETKNLTAQIKGVGAHKDALTSNGNVVLNITGNVIKDTLTSAETEKRGVFQFFNNGFDKVNVKNNVAVSTTNQYFDFVSVYAMNTTDYSEAVTVTGNRFVGVAFSSGVKSNETASANYHAYYTADYKTSVDGEKLVGTIAGTDYYLDYAGTVVRSELNLNASQVTTVNHDGLKASVIVNADEYTPAFTSATGTAFTVYTEKECKNAVTTLAPGKSYFVKATKNGISVVYELYVSKGNPDAAEYTGDKYLLSDKVGKMPVGSKFVETYKGEEYIFTVGKNAFASVSQITYAHEKNGKTTTPDIIMANGPHIGGYKVTGVINVEGDNTVLKSDFVTDAVKIATIGDSVTEGTGHNYDPDTHASGYTDGKTYPQHLQTMLNTAYGEGNYTVKNFGKENAAATPVNVTQRVNYGGNRNQYIRGSWYYSLCDYNPDVVVIMIGYNDTDLNNKTYKGGKVYEESLREIIDSVRALDSHPQIVFSSTHYTYAGGARENIIDSVITSVQKRLAEEYGAIFVDNSGLVKDPETNAHYANVTAAKASRYYLDGVHLLSPGYEIMAQNIKSQTEAIYSSSRTVTTDGVSVDADADVSVSTKTKVAAIGDDLSYGALTYGGYYKYLQSMLGNGYEVRNYAEPQSTVVDGDKSFKTYDSSYGDIADYPSSKAWAPDVAIFSFGKNDTAGEDFKTAYVNLIKEYEALGAEIYITTVLNDAVNANIREIAAANSWTLIDLYSATSGWDASMFTDSSKVLFSDAGNEEVAEFIHAAISCDDFTSRDDSNDTIKNTAVAVIPAAANAQTGNEVVASWQGVYYKFIVGTNAFGTVADALTDSSATQVIIPATETAIAVDINRSVTIYGENYNVMPWVVNGENVVKADAWGEFGESKVTNVTIGAAATGATIKVMGLDITGGVIDTARARSNEKTDITLENTILTKNTSTSTREFNLINQNNLKTADDSYTNIDAFTIKNMLFVNNAPHTDGCFLQEGQPAYFTIDGFACNDNMQSFGFPKWNKAVKSGEMKLVNSYIKNNNASSSKFPAVIYFSGHNSSSYSTDERLALNTKVTVDNNTFVNCAEPITTLSGNAGTVVGAIEIYPGSHKTIDITNNTFVSTNDDSTKVVSWSAHNLISTNDKNFSANITFSKNRVVGYMASLHVNDLTTVDLSGNYFETALNDYKAGAPGDTPADTDADTYIDFELTTKRSDMIPQSSSTITGLKALMPIDTVYGYSAGNVASFDFANANGVTYKVYSDANCTTEITSLNVTEGEASIAYLKATKGTLSLVYKLIVMGVKDTADVQNAVTTIDGITDAALYYPTLYAEPNGIEVIAYYDGTPVKFTTGTNVVTSQAQFGVFGDNIVIPDNITNVTFEILTKVNLFSAQEITTNLTSRKVKIACVGDSITEGRVVPEGTTQPTFEFAYPVMMQNKLGTTDYEVQGFGQSGRTVTSTGALKNGDERSYKTSSASVEKYNASIAYNGDVVIIGLGTNDVNWNFWTSNDRYIEAYVALVRDYQALSSKPAIYITTATERYDATTLISARVAENLRHIQRIVADITGAQIIDNYTIMDDLFDSAGTNYSDDKLHPNKDGYKIYGERIAAELTKTYTGASCQVVNLNGEQALNTHTLSDVAGQDKTCDQDGWQAYQECTKCDYDNQVVIPAGHGDYVQNKDDNEHWLECEDCQDKKDVEEHSFDDDCDTICNGCDYTREITHDHQPDYDTTHHFKECTVCGDVIEKATHNFGETCGDTKCIGCDYERDTTHSYETKYDQTNHWQECSVCNDVINTMPHDMSNELSKDADNHWYQCTACEHKENIAPHDYQPQKDADNHWKECSDCHDVIGTTPHNYERKHDGTNHWEECSGCHSKINEQSANYVQKNDQATHWNECFVCGDKVNQAAHTINNVGKQDPTCTEDGWDAYEYCEHCDYTTYVKQPAGHKLNDVVAKDKTCTEPGYTAHKACTECDYKEGYQVIEAGHELKDVVAKSATCTEDGYTAHKVCEKCGYTEGKTVIAKGHSFGEYVYNNDATFDKDGTKTRTCSVCGHTETVTATETKKPIVNTAEVFTDVVKGEWYKEYVDLAYSYGIFKGNEDGTFKPLANITRAEFVQVLANLSGIDTTNKKVLSKFVDVKYGEWYTPAIKWANANGIVAGKSETHFAPDEAITREQMCVMLVNYANFRGISLVAVEAKQAFVDDANISDWAKAAVYTCQMADIVNGKGEGRFDPQNTGIRAEASVIFTKFYKAYLQ